jgi:NTE family protein
MKTASPIQPPVTPGPTETFTATAEQIVLVCQGGGALGAYQGGVFQALEEAGITPDWVIGTSIGAINAALIAGNAPGQRLERLVAFWHQVRQGSLAQFFAAAPLTAGASTAATAITGLPGFFTPNYAAAWLGTNWPLGAERAGFYGCAPLQRTLEKLIDFDRLNNGDMRLTVGAANVRTGQMRYFDTRNEKLSVAHVMASGALPPAFPAIRIDGDLYWDGGVLSNTPVEAVFDDNPRRSSLVFSVHVWNPQGEEPDTLQKVITREKDLRYASRTNSHIERQRQLHRLRHVIAELSRMVLAAARDTPEASRLTSYGCVTRMHVVQLLAPSLQGEDHHKDVDFSASGIRRRWQAGIDDTVGILAQAPWKGDFEPLEGFVLHEAASAATAPRS